MKTQSAKAKGRRLQQWIRDQLIEKLEDCDDVQNIALNCNFSDEILENL